MSACSVKRFYACGCGLVLIAASTVMAADWPRFRGSNGAGIADGSSATPNQWSETENLRWEADLPGKGVSSPIVVGDRVIVTCWTGEGPDNLVRHVLCYDRKTGRQMWDTAVPPAEKDEPFDQMITQTGYTASTPTSDGKQIFCFFGVSGVYAFDMDGKQQWRTSVGTNFDEKHWGTASSPILYKDMVIVPAASESNSLVALKKSNGEEAWKYESEKLDGTWSTPILVELSDGRTELVMDVPGEIWGIDPDTGKQRWFCKGTNRMSACASLVANGDIVYAIIGRNGGNALGVRCGGEGDVSGSHVVWKSNHQGGIGSALYHDGLLYWTSGDVMNCATAEDGKKVYQERFKAPETAEADKEVKQASAEEPAEGEVTAPAPATSGDGQTQAEEGQESQGPGGPGRFDGPGGGRRFGGPGGPSGPGGGRGRFGGRGFGGGFMSQDYSSPVIADGKIYFVRRKGEVYVLELGREYKQVAVNKFPGEADYSATPAIADGEIFIRSDKKLYCVGNVGQL